MRTSTALFVVLASIQTISAADQQPFAGDWVPLPSEPPSHTGAKSARILIESDHAGGWRQLYEVIPPSGPPIRMIARVQFNDADEQTTQDGRDLLYRSRRIDAGAVEIEYRERAAGQPISTLRLSLDLNRRILTATSTDAASNTSRQLRFERLAEGPLLEPGKSVRQPFGPAAACSFRVSLKAGDYLRGRIDPTGGGVNGAFYGPSGERLFNLGGPAQVSRAFGLIASIDGVYKLVLRSPANAASRFVIKTESPVPVERRAPAAPARPPIEKFESPRIEALRTAVKQGRRDAVAVFWRAVEQEGAPIIERVDGNPYDDLVTFLWRGAASTRNVLILWAPFTMAKPSEYAMSQIGDSGVWYRTLSIRRGARFAYQLSPNDPMTFDDDAAIERSAAAQVDPLNPRKWFGGPFDSPYESSSVVEMPDARPQPYSTRREGVPAGRLEPARIASALLGNTRTLTIYTPPAYRKDGPPNGLLIVFDESAYLTMVPTPVILDNLIAEGRIPPMVAVLVGNPDPAARARELPPNPAFASFLNDELVPWVRQRYHVTRDPSKVVVAGSSFGGIASVYAGLRHPETFGAILCQSGSFWWADPKPAPYAEPNFLAREFIRSPKLPLRFYLDAGAFEVDLSGQGNGILLPSRHMRDVLLARGYSVRYQENIGGHDYLSWRGSFADGLIALMAPAE